MTYRISYGEIRMLTADTPYTEDVERTEYFRTEHEALNRARELIEASEHRAISMADDYGNVLGGFRLQLRLGYTGE